MNRCVRDLRQLINESRQALGDDSSDDGLTSNNESHCQTTNGLPNQIGR